MQEKFNAPDSTVDNFDPDPDGSPKNIFFYSLTFYTKGTERKSNLKKTKPKRTKKNEEKKVRESKGRKNFQSHPV